jgi:hypothetical protein
MCAYNEFWDVEFEYCAGPRPDPRQLMGKRETGSKFHPTKFWFFCEWFYTAISNYHAMFSAKLGI